MSQALYFSLHWCGLPHEMAIELFRTFVICDSIRQYFALNIGVAKIKIWEKKVGCIGHTLRSYARASCIP